MDELGRAMELALDASRPYPSVVGAVERAVALARFQADDPIGGPFWRGALSSGVPQRPQAPLFPALAGVPATPLGDALEALQCELVWAADCAEYSDATNNAAQFLRAAGHVELAQRAALALAGPGLGIVLTPPRLVRELAAGLGLPVADLLGEGSLLGMLPPHPSVSASFRWDVHHEAPVTTAEALGARELESYSVRIPEAEPALGATYGAPREIAGRRRYGPFFFSGGAIEWYTTEPDWALPPVDLRAALASGEQQITFAPPVSALELAEALGAPDATACTVGVHMSSWEVELPGAVATLDGWATGETYSLPAALGAKLAPGDKVRHLRFTDPRAR